METKKCMSLENKRNESMHASAINYSNEVVRLEVSAFFFCPAQWLGIAL